MIVLRLLVDLEELADPPPERQSLGVGGLKSLGCLTDQLVEPLSILVMGLPGLVLQSAKLVDLRA